MTNFALDFNGTYIQYILYITFLIDMVSSSFYRKSCDSEKVFNFHF